MTTSTWPTTWRGLKVLNVSDPRQPRVVGFCSTYQARDLAVRGNFAYVADHVGGIAVADISAPEDPWVLATRRTTGCDSAGVAVSGRYAYAADFDAGVAVIDLLGQ